MPALAAIEPNSLFQASFSFEPQLRARYLRLESTPRSSGKFQDSDLIEQSACFLEVLLVSASIHEALAQLSITTSEVTPEIAAQMRDRTLALYGLDPVLVVNEACSRLGINSLKKPDFELSLEAVVRAMNAILETCPIDHLEALAAKRGLEAWGHRCRIAYDGIKAFVLRNGSSQKAQVSVVGEAYARGSLSTEDVATLLDVHPVDAVALLESHGYKRSLDRLALAPEKRAEIFSRMREDRRGRSGKPRWSTESIARDVLASERLEGVDARRWVPRDGQ